MADIYERLAATARRLLAKYGKPIAFTRKIDEVKNPATGAIITPGSAQVFSPKGVVVPIDSKLIDGTRIKAGDKVLITDDTFAPAMTDKVDGWAIMEIRESNPAGTPLVYFSRIRK